MSVGQKTYEITLADGRTVLALTDREPLVRFFRPVAAAFGEPLFACWVHKSAYRAPAWKLLRGVEAPPALDRQPLFFKADLVSKRVHLYDSPKEVGQASLADIDRLEPAAVWEDHDLELRLTDALDGRPDRLVESMRSRSRELISGVRPATG